MSRFVMPHFITVNLMINIASDSKGILKHFNNKIDRFIEEISPSNVWNDMRFFYFRILIKLKTSSYVLKKCFLSLFFNNFQYCW